MKLVHLLRVDPDGLCRTRACGAEDGHVNFATVFLKSVTCMACVAAWFFGQGAARGGA